MTNLGNHCQNDTRKRLALLSIFYAGFPILIALHGVGAAERTEGASARTLGALQWGSYLKPFAVNSLWNSRPVAPVLGEFLIPKSNYFPALVEAKYSTGVFLSKASDKPMTVTGPPGSKGLLDSDSEVYRDVTIPRWPEDTIPAEGTDGHAEIVDPFTGIVHSFWVLRKREGRWDARLYSWTRIDGRGWPDPAHYKQGARAAAVSSMAGLIRKHEVGDGDNVYRHALAMSLTFNGLAAKPAYIFPATSADTDAATTNSGLIPEGALMMLPKSYDTKHITNVELRKVAETLKTYGAYVVDRNVGTPFAIYVELGAGLNLYRDGWNTSVATELDRIRQALRQVVSVGGWLDGNGSSYTPEKNLNLLSMRGPWRTETPSAIGVFDSSAQAVLFPSTLTRIVQVNNTARGLQAVSWAVPRAGTSYRLTALATGEAKLQLQLRNKADGNLVFDSGELGNGEAATFIWPTQSVAVIIRASSGVGVESSVRGELLSTAH